MQTPPKVGFDVEMMGFLFYKEKWLLRKAEAILKTSGITCKPLRQQQPRKRSCRPWGCYLRPGSPSSRRKIRLSAAFRLRRRDFWSGKPGFSQNKKHITKKHYVVLSFYGDILSHHVFTKQGILTKLNTFNHHFINSIIFNHLSIIRHQEQAKINHK